MASLLLTHADGQEEIPQSLTHPLSTTSAVVVDRVEALLHFEKN